MKIKVGNKIYDSEKEPVMVILTENDKINIANMLPCCDKYASYPEHISIDEIDDWMECRGEEAPSSITKSSGSEEDLDDTDDTDEDPNLESPKVYSSFYKKAVRYTLSRLGKAIGIALIGISVIYGAWHLERHINWKYGYGSMVEQQIEQQIKQQIEQQIEQAVAETVKELDARVTSLENKNK
jgi:hypothetical protein